MYNVQEAVCRIDVGCRDGPRFRKLRFGRAQGGADGYTIVEIAAGNPNFSTLVAAVGKAGLVDTLNGKGQYTVFAPTNAAFDNLAVALWDTAKPAWIW